MKSIYPALISLFLFTSIGGVFSQTCLEDGIVFTSQEQLDSFSILYPDCEIIEGSVILEGVDIDNLQALSGIKYIMGSLECLDNEPEANFFAGLSELDSIGGDFEIFSVAYPDPVFPNSSFAHTQLGDFQGLNNLKKIGGDLRIINQDSLVNFVGLENLEIIEGSFVLFGVFSPFLDNVTGLNGLSEIGLDLSIEAGIEDFTGFDSLKKIGRNFISYTSSIWDYYGLENLEHVSGGMVIRGGYDLSPLGNLRYVGSLATLWADSLIGLAQLERVGDFVAGNGLYNFKGLESLQMIEEDLLIVSEVLSDFEGLEALQFIGGDLLLEDKETISSFNGLSGVDTIGGDLIIRNLESLQDFSGLENLQYVDGEIVVENNPNLLSLQGLSSLKIVGFWFSIVNNPSLVSLGGVEMLDSVNVLQIEANNALTNLDGLEGLEFISNSLRIENNLILSDIQALGQFDPEPVNTLFLEDNPQLSFCAIPSICFIVNNTTAYVSNNAEGCQSWQGIRDSCLILSNSAFQNFESVQITPNPTTGTIQLLDQGHKVWGVRIFNTLGAEVLNGIWSSDQILDISHLPSDLYFLELSNEKGRFLKKVFKR